MLPIIEALEDCQSDAERADWLLRLPDSVVLDCFDQVRNMLITARFRPGFDFLETRRMGLIIARQGDGLLPPGLSRALDDMRALMRALVLGVPLAVLQ